MVQENYTISKINCKEKQVNLLNKKGKNKKAAFISGF